MISPQAQKGFLFAFLLVVAGGLVCIGGGFSPGGLSILSLIGLVLVAFGLLIGLFSLAA